ILHCPENIIILPQKHNLKEKANASRLGGGGRTSFCINSVSFVSNLLDFSDVFRAPRRSSLFFSSLYPRNVLSLAGCTSGSKLCSHRERIALCFNQPIT